MSREIRPVALDWEHPVDHANPTYRDGSTRYLPLHSRADYRADVAELILQCDAIERGELDYNDADLEPVRDDEYMPEMKEGTPYGWQLYETVSEGTPCSPVFATKDELGAWLSSPGAGHERVSPEAAAAFVAEGWAPTFRSSPAGGLVRGTEAAGGQA